jgi:hypothetical protein
VNPAKTLLPFGLAFLFVLLPWFPLGAGGPIPPEKVDKPKEKPAEGTKDDKTKGDDKGGKDDKTKVEDKGGPPTPERYGELLKSDKVLVRKRAAMVLMQKGRDAFPALLELLLREQDKELKLFLADKVLGDDLYSTPEKVSALAKALKDPAADLARRQAACTVMPGLAKNENAKAQLSEIKEALEFALADSNEELQVAAAGALEAIDNPKGLADRQKRRTVVRLSLDPAGLKALRLKSDEIVEAIQKEFPESKPKVVEENDIEVSVTEAERAGLTEKVRVRASGDVRLKDVILKQRIGGK